MHEDTDDLDVQKQPKARVVVPSPHLQEAPKLRVTNASKPRQLIAKFKKSFEPWKQTSGHRGSFLAAALITFVGLVASLLHPVLGAVVISLTAYFYLSSPGMLVVCVACFPVLTSLNSAVFLRDQGTLGVQFVLIAASYAALFRMVVKQRLRPGKLCLLLTIFGILGGLFGALTSTAPGESVLSVIKFVAPLMPLMFWADQLFRRGLGLGPSSYAFAGVLAATTFGSLLVWFIGLGYTLNKTDFQGLFWHPQTCGLALGLACIFSALLPRLPNWLRIGWFFTALVLTLLSWTRTAFIALLVAAVLIGLWMLWQHWRPRFRYGRSIATLSTLGLIASLTTASALYASTLKPADYLLETSTQLFSEEAYAGARTFALYRSYDNFVQKPFVGIGFGVPSDPRLLDPAFAQETSARIKAGQGSEVLPDKGNAFLATLEENGVIGGALWLGFFAYCLALAAKSGPVGLAVGGYLTISNLAEATLFSLGGIGMTLWAGMIVAMTIKSTDLQLTWGWLHLRRQS